MASRVSSWCGRHDRLHRHAARADDGRWHRGRPRAIVNFGITVAVALGNPAGAFVGGHFAGVRHSSGLQAVLVAPLAVAIRLLKEIPADSAMGLKARLAEKASAFVRADDDHAKAVVARLVEGLGLDAVNGGKLAVAPHAEGPGMFAVRLPLDPGY